MTVLSLFDGLSGGRIALQRANISVTRYYSSEIDKYAIKIADKNHPQDSAYRLGDVTKWREWDIDWSSIDLLLAGFPCFTKGTLITTIDGMKSIEDIKVGDLVLTHNNRFRPVLTTMQKVSNHINNVKIQGCHMLSVTDEHPFYVREKIGNKLTAPKWVECKDLTKNHYIGNPINKNEIPPSFNTTEPFWFMVGRYIADGYHSTTNLQSRGQNKGYRRSYKTIITCGKHEGAEVEQIITDAGYHATKSEEPTGFKFAISDKSLWEFITQFGRGASEKMFPGFIFDMPIPLVKSLIDGYLSGDGHRVKETNKKSNKGLVAITTISPYLAYGVQHLIQKAYGTRASVTKHNPTATTVIEGRTVNQRPTYLVRFHKRVPTGAKYINGIDEYLWSPFRSIDRYIEPHFVYNLEVDEDNSYSVFNLIAHNCQAWSLAGQQGGDSDPRGALMHDLIAIWRHIESLNPNLKFLFENVKMKKEFSDYINNLFGVQPILINSALLSAQNRQRYYWTNIPNVTQPEDKGIFLKDILEDGFIADRDKSYCIDANYAKGGNLNTYFDKSRRQLVFEPRPMEFKQESTTSSLCKLVGYATDIKGNESILRVYSPEGKSPTLTTMGGGHREPKVLCGAFRGRYVVDGKRQDSKMLTAGLTEQRLEVRPDGKANTLTTVQKDNVVTYLSQFKISKNSIDTYVPDKTALACDPYNKTALSGDKSTTLRLNYSNGNSWVNTEVVGWRKLTPLECERLQTLDDGYTEGVSNSQRYKMIGNGWTIDVIAHILRGLRESRT